MSKALHCRRVRGWLQEQHDREGPAPLAEGQLRAARPWQEASPRAQAAEVHLEGCPECRRFREFLESYGRELAASLDALSGRPPLPETAAAATRPAAPQRGRVPARGARGSVARWAVPAAAAALLGIAAGTQVPRLAASVRVERRIRAEMAALVEELYSRPLAQGVEAGLAGGGLLEGLAEGDGLQGLGEGEDPALPGGDILSP
jgi:hypothetical protein